MASTSSLEATACWTAAARALETARGDRLLDDPWAGGLAGTDGQAWIDARSPESVLPIVLRTRYFDDWLVSVVSGGDLRQVVLLGAGLDTRAFRLPWPDGCVVFEVDRAPVLEHKARVLAAAEALPRCERRTAAADLREDWAEALHDVDFDRGRPAAWLLEGLLFYLPGDEVTRLLDAVSAMAPPRSQLGFDVVNAAILTSPYTKPWVEMQAAAGAPWLSTMEDPVGFLAERGWTARLTQAGQPDANQGRWILPVVPTTLPDFPHSWFVTATRVGRSV
jgi:methyltransferase (TIGR00027 family)